VAASTFFDRRTGVEVPAGTQAFIEQEPGHVPRVQWDVSIWTGVMRQLEGFNVVLHKFGIRSIVHTLGNLAQQTKPTTTPGTLMLEDGNPRFAGWNTLIDR
jgi:hypothetical protein